MYVVTVIFEPHAGGMEAFLPLMMENARLSLADEPGCHRFDVSLSEDGTRVFLYELYSDEAAFGQHVQSPHFKAFDRAIADMIARKTVETYSLL
jgi:quinol monooxygenase YgiN